VGKQTIKLSHGAFSLPQQTLGEIKLLRGWGFFGTRGHHRLSMGSLFCANFLWLFLEIKGFR